MVEASVLKAFVTAVACLCASNYDPKGKATSNFDEIFLKMITDGHNESGNSSIFYAHEKFDNCSLPSTGNADFHLRSFKNEPQYDFKNYRTNCKEQELVEADQAQIQSLELKIEILRVHLCAFKNSVYKINERNKNLEKQIERLRTENESLQKEKTDFKTQNKNLNKEISRIKSIAPRNLEKLQNNCLILESSVVASFGGGWILIAQRFDGSVDFNRTWHDYAHGFGVYGQQNEFFAGLDNVYALTQNSTQKLLVVLNDNKNVTRYAHYDNFSILKEKESYKLASLGNYTGNADDSLTAHLNQNFATFDKDNEWDCAKEHAGGWWYLDNDDCVKSNLFGQYPKQQNHIDFKASKNYMFWSPSNKNNDGSLTSMRMYVRPTELEVYLTIE